jgi:hypothetical protein
VYFQFLELRHKIELHNLTGRVIECPLDEMNRPRASAGPQLRVPPAEEEVGQLFAGWREELSTCRKFAPAARNYAVARLAADVGCGSTRPGCWTWTTCGGSWAGSASCTPATAEARGGARTPSSAPGRPTLLVALVCPW